MIIKIKIIGVGGQGIQFIGKLLGEAAFKQGLNVSMGVLYEPSTSGGLTLADVIIAHKDDEILYPFIEDPTILVLFSQRSWDENKHLVNEDTIIMADKSNIQDFSGAERDKARLAFHLPFAEKAEELGSGKSMNVVALGFISEFLDLGNNHVPSMIREWHPEESEEYDLLEVDPENFEDSLIQSSPKRFEELNLNAFKTGYDMAMSNDYNPDLKLKIVD